MKLTNSQQAAVAARGTNLLVSASAGSGKTEVLSRRCVELVADAERGCGIDRLLVVTFTRAAAAELRSRIAGALRNRAEAARGAVLRDHLQRQAILVDTAEIGTIDAWCGRIVREHFAAAGVDPAFRVLAAQEAELLRADTLDALFDWIYTSDDSPAAAGRDWIARNAKPNAEFLRRMIAAVSRNREHLINPEQWFAGQRARYAGADQSVRTDAQLVVAEALAGECRFQAEQLEAVLAEASDERVLVALREYQAALYGWDERLASVRNVIDIADEISVFRVPRPRKLEGPDGVLFDEVRDRWLKKRLQKRWNADPVRRIVEGAPEAARLALTLLELEQRYREMLADAKRARAAYEFGDVLRMALDLLGTPGEDGRRARTPIARRLQQRFAHILVDEYQDTSPVQVELLRLVTREGAEANAFFVGDVKQSVYGFRQAEPRLFSELIEAFSSGRRAGRVLPLADNFRSHADLLAGLNGIFAMLFDPELGGTRFGDEQKLTARRDEIDNTTLDHQPRIQLHLLESGKRGGPPEADAGDEIELERIEREAVVTAGLIRDLLDGGTRVPERGEDGRTGLRALRPADIVILLRSAKKNAGLVAQTLRKEGIACVAGGRESILDSVEVSDVRTALSLLSNRRQDVALAAYLRAPMVGLSAGELLEIRRNAAHGDYYDALESYRKSGKDKRLSERIEAALRQLDRWAAAARERELPELLRVILRETGLVHFAQALPGGEHRVEMLRALERLAAEFAKASSAGAAEFVDYLAALAEAELAPSAAAGGGEDAVRVHTIHFAKGLEYPVVFLLNTGADFRLVRSDAACACDETHGLGLKFFDYPERAERISAAYEVIRADDRQRELEEELRLLYVAATRARERLYVLGHAPAEKWNEVCARYGRAGGAPPLISRLSASGMLEWVLMGVASAGLHESGLVSVEMCAAERVEPEKDGDESGGAKDAEWRDEDQRWVARGRELLEAGVDTRLAELPAVLSVSALKERTERLHGEDAARSLDTGRVGLRKPQFAAESEREDGRVVGTACHRFLQLADLQRIGSEADVRSQIEGMIAAGELSADEARLVSTADVAWFGVTGEGRLLADAPQRVRRETPFVYGIPIGGGERTVVRGVIDCLVETDEGLVILDYKTDRITNDAELRERVGGYAVQLRLYAEAAAAIFGQPVVRAALVFLSARRMVDVPVGGFDVNELIEAAGVGATMPSPTR